MARKRCRSCNAYFLCSSPSTFFAMVSVLLACQLAAAALIHDSLIFRVQSASVEEVQTIRKISGGDSKTAIVFVSLICSIATLLLSFGLLAPGLAASRGRCGVCQEVLLLCKGRSWMCNTRAPPNSVFAWFQGSYRPAMTDRAAFMGQLMAMFWLVMGSLTLVGSVAELLLPASMSVRSALGMQALMGRSPNAVMTPLGVGLLYTMDVTSAELFQLRQPSDGRKHLWHWASRFCRVSPIKVDGILHVWLHWGWRAVFWFIAKSLEVTESGCALNIAKEPLCRYMPFLNLLLVSEFAIWAVAKGLLLKSRVMQVAIARAIPLLTVSLALPGILLEFVLPPEVTSPPLVWATGLVAGILLPAAAYIMLLWEDSYKMDALTRFLRYISHEVRVPANTAVLAVGEILHECNRRGELPYTMHDFDCLQQKTFDADDQPAAVHKLPAGPGGVVKLQGAKQGGIRQSPAGSSSGVSSGARTKTTKKVNISPLVLTSSTHHSVQPLQQAPVFGGDEDSKALPACMPQPIVHGSIPDVQQSSSSDRDMPGEVPDHYVVGLNPSDEASFLTSLSGGTSAGHSSARSGRSSAAGMERNVQLQTQGTVMSMNSLQLSTSSAHVQSLPAESASPEGTQRALSQNGADKPRKSGGNDKSESSRAQSLSGYINIHKSGVSKRASSHENSHENELPSDSALPSITLQSSAEQLQGLPTLSGEFPPSGGEAMIPGPQREDSYFKAIDGPVSSSVALPHAPLQVSSATAASSTSPPRNDQDCDHESAVEYGEFNMNHHVTVKLRDIRTGDGRVQQRADRAVADAMRTIDEEGQYGRSASTASDNAGRQAQQQAGSHGHIRAGGVLVSPRSPSNAPNMSVIHSAARDADSSLQHLQALLDRTLDLARLEAGIASLESSTFSLQKLWRGVKTAISPVYRNANVSLHMPSTLPNAQLRTVLLCGDALRLRQAMANILQNGSKYTPAGQRVFCSLSLTPLHHPSANEEQAWVASTANHTQLMQPTPQAEHSITPTTDVTNSSMGTSFSVDRKSSNGSDATIVASSPVAHLPHRLGATASEATKPDTMHAMIPASSARGGHSRTANSARAIVQWHSRESVSSATCTNNSSRNSATAAHSHHSSQLKAPASSRPAAGTAQVLPAGAVGGAWMSPGAPCLLRVTVQDQGRGMTHLEQATLFEAFSRLHTADEGTGLGLNIAKRAMQAHGGDVQVHSEGLGKGCTFTITAVVHIAQEGAMAEGSTEESSAGGGVSPMPTPPALPTTAHLVDSSSSGDLTEGPRVLVVDDDDSTRRLVSRMMVRNPAVKAVATACDGQEAVEFVLQAMRVAAQQTAEYVPDDPASKLWVPTHITLDNSMPRMSGRDAAQRLRAAGFAGRIVGVTGNSMPAEQVDFKALGADVVLTKPVQRDSLMAALHI